MDTWIVEGKDAMTGELVMRGEIQCSEEKLLMLHDQLLNEEVELFWYKKPTPTGERGEAE